MASMAVPLWGMGHANPPHSCSCSRALVAAARAPCPTSMVHPTHTSAWEPKHFPCTPHAPLCTPHYPCTIHSPMHTPCTATCTPQVLPMPPPMTHFQLSPAPANHLHCIAPPCLDRTLGQDTIVYTTQNRAPVNSFSRQPSDVPSFAIPCCTSVYTWLPSRTSAFACHTASWSWYHSFV